MKKIILFSIFYFLFSILATQAAGLVPCGGIGENPCTYCDLLAMLKRIVDFAVYIVFPLAAIMIVWGGIVIMTARENPGRVTLGRGIITAAVIGILIALLGWLIIDTILKVIAPNFEVASLGPWQELKCQ